ncbi:hypothetical protein G6F22_020688 [Rhizopus arrhizus]|nr:hypothetical protein G6F22_020688 [Rhizopus arrhizus]
MGFYTHADGLPDAESGRGRPAGPANLAGAASDFLDELRLQAHLAEAVDLAIDVVVAVDQADAFDLGAHLDHPARPLEFQVLDDGDGVAVLQDVAG